MILGAIVHTTGRWFVIQTTIDPGLTTTEAPFIDEAQREGKLYIYQPYELYSPENHEAWRRLYSRMRPLWAKYANRHFRKGIESLCLDPGSIPHLEDVNRFLHPLTGFQAKAVSGYVPAFVFFDCLRNREFPTTITIRRLDKLDYLPEPRSEERRVGKECRSRWSAYHEKNKRCKESTAH